MHYFDGGVHDIDNVSTHKLDNKIAMYMHK